MAEDLDDHRRVFDGSDDLQSAAAVRAVLHVDIEDPFEQPGPAQARRFSLGDVIGRGLGGTLWRSGNDFTAQLGVGRQHAMEAGLQASGCKLHVTASTCGLWLVARSRAISAARAAHQPGSALQRASHAVIPG